MGHWEQTGEQNRRVRAENAKEPRWLVWVNGHIMPLIVGLMVTGLIIYVTFKDL